MEEAVYNAKIYVHQGLGARLQKNLFVCVLRFSVPDNNFLVMSGQSHRFLGFNQYSRELICLAQGHNTVTLVGIAPRTSRFGVRRSTTRPPRYLQKN